MDYKWPVDQIINEIRVFKLIKTLKMNVSVSEVKGIAICTGVNNNPRRLWKARGKNAVFSIELFSIAVDFVIFVIFVLIYHCYNCKSGI